MGFFSGLASGLTSALSSAGNFFSGGGNTLVDRLFHRDDRKDAQGDRIWEWNLQNQYNSPSAQMKRLKEAGLNPYLYSASLGGLSAGGIAPSSPSTPSVDLGIGSAINHANNWKARKEQLELERDKFILNKNVIEKVILNNRVLKAKEEGYELDNEMKRNQILYDAHKMGLDEKYYDLNVNKFNTYQNHLINQDKLANLYYYNTGSQSEHFDFGIGKVGWSSSWKNPSSAPKNSLSYFVNYFD